MNLRLRHTLACSLAVLLGVNDVKAAPISFTPTSTTNTTITLNNTGILNTTTNYAVNTGSGGGFQQFNPKSTTPDPDKHNWMCKNFEQADYTDLNSPFIADCQQIAANIHHDGTWIVTFGNKKIVSFGTCALSVHGRGWNFAMHSISTEVGNEDVRKIINDAVGQFGHDGKVAATGGMECGRDANVVWAIYHT